MVGSSITNHHDHHVQTDGPGKKAHPIVQMSHSLSRDLKTVKDNITVVLGRVRYEYSYRHWYEGSDDGPLGTMRTKMAKGALDDVHQLDGKHQWLMITGMTSPRRTEHSTNTSEEPNVIHRSFYRSLFSI